MYHFILKFKLLERKFLFTLLYVLQNVFLTSPVCSIMSAMQIKLLFQTGFDEEELKNYIPVIHANVYQTIKVRNTWKGVLVIFIFAK